MNTLTRHLISSVGGNGGVDRFVSVLFEGGAFGHLAHPFEDIDMTFAQMKDMVNYILSGQAVAYEKIDGQQLSFSWKNGRLILARNKSQMKNYGENALTTDTIRSFIGKSGNVPENVINAFHQAAIDLEKAMLQVPPAELQNTFQEGKRFMNSEVVAQETENVIPYYKDYIVFHGLIEYDESGRPVSGQMREPAERLEKILKSKGATDQTKFVIKDSNRIILKNFSEMPERKKAIDAELKKLQGNMPDKSTISQQQERWWRDFIVSKAKEFGYQISNDALASLTAR